MGTKQIRGRKRIYVKAIIDTKKLTSSFAKSVFIIVLQIRICEIRLRALQSF